MTDALTRLAKVLDLERRQGYRNKAVIGGLDKFAGRWEADARAETSDPDAIAEVVALLIGYPAVEDTAARERIIEKILQRVAESVGSVESRPEPDAAAVAEPAPRLPPEGKTGVGSEREPDRPAETVLPSLSKPATLHAEQRTPTPVPPARQRSRRASPPRQPDSAPPEEDAAPRKPARTPANAAIVAAGLDAPVGRLPSVGPSLSEKLARLGVQTIRDLLYLLPRRYDDFSQLRTIDRIRYGEEVTIIGTPWKIESRIIGSDRKMVNAVVGDGTSEMMMTWFNPYVERQLQRGQAYAFSGRVDSYRGRPMMRNPAFEPLEAQQLHTGRLVPVYPQTEGLTTRWLRRIIKNAVDAWAGDMPDYLPESVRREVGLVRLGEALEQIHFPDNRLRLGEAHRRLSFDEFFLIQLGVLGQRKQFRDLTAQPLAANAEVLKPFLEALPFALTSAQHRVLGDITGDLQKAQPMSRLLQGDVGSGKTAVAAAALWVAVANGSQGAIMAPTEILAEQHARSFGQMFSELTHPQLGRPVRVALFTGSMTRSERDAALAELAAGDIDIAIGTHALIQPDVAFDELAVVVVDEQHRFGVEQRAALRQKGIQPHMLVMSATPIPRSLALTIYGDLDISAIDEMPAGRIPIRTKWLTSAQRERAHSFLRRQVAEGRQAFVVYPLIEEGSQPGALSAVEEHARLSREIFPDLRLGLLHGRLKSEEKDAVMRAFVAGDLDILVATSVVEVGIDVPNASVIIIEGADRFGLAQLHQFRGRVGRGEHPSYCVLLSDADSGDSVQRLQALETNNDGFALAQIDLELRGPGDFFGTRQSGLPPLVAAELGDLRTLEEARAAAQQIFATDPELERPEHRALAEQVSAFWANTGDVS